MRRALCAVFFLSGAAALLFENLWFRQAGLAFGNSVFAQSVVLAAFMAGLGLGNALATRTVAPFRRPIRIYAGLEVLVAITGVLLVFALPSIGELLQPVLRRFVDRPFWLNAARLGVTLVLLTVPTTAMGLTLPLLTKALARSGRGFGANLGALYGWNTLGAVAGALGVETVFVSALGVRGTGLLAGGLNLVAAAVGLGLARRHESLGETAATPAPSVGDTATPSPSGGEPVATGEPRREPATLGALTGESRILATAFVVGAVLLALEVVWFRFLALFCDGSSLTLALLLAMVLAGIALGGLAAGAWLGRRPEAVEWLGALLALAGLLVVALYSGFNTLPPRLGGIRFSEPAPILALAAFLTFPVSFVSGIVFTLLGTALHERVRREVVSTGALTLANTMGAAVGALGGGFVLLPVLGMERSFAVLAAGYGLALLLLPKGLRIPTARPKSRLAYLALGLYALFWVLFPYGFMNATYLRMPLLLLGRGENVILAAREGLTETAVYVEQRVEGERMAVRLVTNGFSMSATGWGARRYMGFYVYLPVALHPRPRHALLICYGVGSTARALVHSRELETIDVVDISREVLEMSRVVYPDPGGDPLADPRVTKHVEDGRAFLDLTDRRFDLITAEPPPPTNAGVVNLYSQEFFEKMRSRLAEGGFATYWLPVHTLADRPTRAVIRSFCSAFPDCTLWKGQDLDWMLVGTKNAAGPVSEERARLQWSDPVVGAELRDVGFETPEQMGATFLADAATLGELASAVPPLTDNWPKRVGVPPNELPTPFAYEVLLGKAGSRAEEFASSPELGRLWPSALGPGAIAALRMEDLQTSVFIERMAGREVDEAWLHEAMTTTSARLPVIVFLGSDPDRQRIARIKAGRGERGAFVLYHLAVAALADRRPGAASSLAREALAAGEPRGRFLLAYALALDGRGREVLPLLAELRPASRTFLEKAFGLTAPGP